MLKKFYDSNKKLVVIIVILLISLYLLPFLSQRPCKMNISVPIRNKIGKAGETVEFKMIFEQKNGFERHYVIRDVVIYEGDWEFSIEGTSIYVPPDSTVKIYITIKIPEDAQNGDEYYLYFDCYEKKDEAKKVNPHGGSFTVTVDNREPPVIEVRPGHGYSNSTSSCFYLSPFLFIPLGVIIFCVFLLIMALFYYSKKGIGINQLKAKGYKRNNLLLSLLIVNILLTIFSISFAPLIWYFMIQEFNFWHSIFLFIWVTNILNLIIRLLSVIFVYIDAKNINAGRVSSFKKRDFRIVSWPPLLWAILVLIFGFIALALYIYKRKEIFDVNYHKHKYKLIRKKKKDKSFST
ncbi:MAG: hypothetical protein JSW00_10040 [Thermoplasmata archaeon]|nr:MAG: hypothetical protein JSW00_10040 [Thermoplasmata archaeon]